MRRPSHALVFVACAGALGCGALVGLAPYEEAPAVDGADAATDGPAADGASTSGWPASCGALRATGETQTSIYVIDPDGVGPLPPVRVFCEMAVDDGGWMLVARTAPDAGPDASFGWHAPRGSVDDPSTPYVLDLTRAPVDFREVLVAAHDAPSGMSPAGHAYAFEVPPLFVDNYQSRSFTANEPAGSGRVVLGACTAWPTFLGFTGFTADFDRFYFQDKNDNETFGLFATGWSLNQQYIGQDCKLEGELTTPPAQGSLFVR